MTDGQYPSEDEALRTQAERRLEHLSLSSKWTDWNSHELAHELNVHHVEIELQNEELQQTLSELEFERRQYIRLYEHAPSAYFTLDARGDILNVNQAGIQLLHVQKDRLLARRFALFLVPEHRAAFQQVIQARELPQAQTHLFALEHLEGQRTDVQLQILTLPVSGQDQPQHLVTLTDITSLLQARAHLEVLNATLEDRIKAGTQELLDLNALLRHQARHDFLTGLPNRAAFAEELQEALLGLHQDQRAFAVLFFDIDRFKIINDSLGHVAGDQVLVELSTRLRGVTRPADQVSRLGGDEFAMLLQDVPDLDIVAHVISRLETAVQQPFQLNGQEVSLMISTGVVLVQNGYETAGEILRDVDVALHQAKRSGRAVSKVFEPSMRGEFEGRLELEAQLRHAVERQELLLHYQPIVSLTDGRPLGLEALVRWQHPDRGFLMPGDFIPLAEELNLVGQIDRWVLEEAERQVTAWQVETSGQGVMATGHTGLGPLWMNVNVSAQNLEQVRQVSVHLIDHPVPETWQMRIEITERVLTHHDDSDPGALAALRAAQVSLVLDDFGMGFSSLSALHRLPVTMLKIDRSFVAMLDENLELVRSILHMGEALGMIVVAEGVETAEQQRVLLNLGVTVAQGWLFAAALPAAEVLEYFRTH
ncbi:hypothetical protein GCM10022631_10160 [Deinococcus rubellus]|uniref:putative bifunctional diguanylate cyclase/phosphodiesterase n=1 Tax=Deinococcus rubellus TaxID=1889240 RepID=UPI0031E80746